MEEIHVRVQAAYLVLHDCVRSVLRLAEDACVAVTEDAELLDHDARENVVRVLGWKAVFSVSGRQMTQRQGR